MYMHGRDKFILISLFNQKYISVLNNYVLGDFFLVRLMNEFILHADKM